MIRRPRGHFSTSSFLLGDKEQILIPDPILEIVAQPQNNTGLEKPKPINPYGKKKPSKYQRG
jgi:hypothetical protein